MQNIDSIGIFTRRQIVNLFQTEGISSDILSLCQMLEFLLNKRTYIGIPHVYTPLRKKEGHIVLAQTVCN